jgi:glycosyltransferase involved in cell wall biosynthesis
MHHTGEEALPARRPKLALVTPWGVLCGIAAYSHHLKAALDQEFDVTVLALDEYLLQSEHPRLVETGDRLIAEYAERMAAFDYVNIQLEFGVIGPTPAIVLKRLKTLFVAAKNLTVTFHTVLQPKPYPTSAVLTQALKLRFGRALTRHAGTAESRLLGHQLFALLRRLQRKKPVKAFVHTRREYRRLSLQEGLYNVFHHPLSFLGAEQIAEVKGSSGRFSFPVLKALPQDVVILGVFGFISPYKNFDFVVQALQHLPANYHLAIFGGVNPKSLGEREARARDLDKLFAAGRFDEALDDQLVRAWLNQEAQRAALHTASLSSALSGPTLSPARRWPDHLPWGTDLAALSATPAVRHPRNVADRVHFLGAMDDEDYFRGMNACDLVVFPYMEVGQTSSGPISQAVELGCRVLAARNKAFLEFAKYHPGRLELYDIGNTVEFVERVKSSTARARPLGQPRYGRGTSLRTYREALTCENIKPRSVEELLDAQSAVWGPAVRDSQGATVEAFEPAA